MSEADKPEPVEIPTAGSVLALLREHEAELRAAGITRASIFGSVARGEANADSDVDLLVRFNKDPRFIGLAHVERILGLQASLEKLLGRPVDLVPEPIRKEGLQRTIDRDGVIAFQ